MKKQTFILMAALVTACDSAPVCAANQAVEDQLAESAPLVCQVERGTYHVPLELSCLEDPQLQRLLGFVNERCHTNQHLPRSIEMNVNGKGLPKKVKVSWQETGEKLALERELRGLNLGPSGEPCRRHRIKMTFLPDSPPY